MIKTDYADKDWLHSAWRQLFGRRLYNKKVAKVRASQENLMRFTEGFSRPTDFELNPEES